MTQTSEKRIVRNTGLMFGGRGGGAIFNFLTLIIVAREIDPILLGVLFLIHSTMMLIGELGAFKSWQALIKFGVGHYAEGNKEALHKLIRFAIGVDLVAVIFAFVVSQIFLWFGMEWVGLDAEYRALAHGYCLLILFRQRSAATGILRLTDRFDLLALNALVFPVVIFLGSLAVMFAGGGFVYFVGAWFLGGLVESITLWIAGLHVLRRKDLLADLFAKPPTIKAPETGLWAFSLTAHADASVVVVKREIPVLLAGGLIGPAFVAVFRIAMQIASVLVRGTQQLDEVIYPELAQLVSAGKTRQIWPIVLRAAGVLVAIALGVGALVAVIGPDMLSWALRTDYRPSAQLAIFLLLAGAISAAYAPLLPTLYAAGRPGQAAVARGVGVGVLLILFVVLTRSFGPNGAGWAFIIGDTVSLILAGVLTHSALKRQMISEANASSGGGIS